MRSWYVTMLVSTAVCAGTTARLHDPPDRGQPGDEMIQAYLRQETQKIHDAFPQDYASLEHWKGLRDRYRQEYFYMLGLSPDAGEDAAAGHGHRHARGRRLRGRHAPLPEPAASCT